MKVLVEGKNLEITPAIRKFAEQQISRRLSKIPMVINQVRVYLENIARKDNDPNSAVAGLRIEIAGKDINIKTQALDIYQAIKNASDVAARKLRKSKEKRLTKRGESVK